MILLTLGTYPMQFNRLIKIMDNLIKDHFISEDVFAQTGFSTYEPKKMNYKKLLEKSEFDKVFAESRLIIGHAGMGSISMSLDHKKPMLVFPRLKKYREHVNDHQLYTARKYQDLGHVLAAFSEIDFIEKLKMLEDFVPNYRTADAVGIADRIIEYIGENLN